MSNYYKKITISTHQLFLMDIIISFTGNTAMKTISSLSRLSIALGVMLMSSFTSFRSSALAEDPSTPISVADNYNFKCYSDKENNLPVTVALNRDDKGKYGKPIIYWKSTYFAGWTPEQRCVEVSRRFQKAVERDALKEIASGYLNGESVIFGVTPDGEKILLFTLESEKEAKDIKRQFNLIIQGQASAGDFYRDVPPSQGGTFTVDLEDLLRHGKKIPLGKPL